MTLDRKTHFGYQRVSETEKTHKVSEVFHDVADQYDLMNDVMSLGLHRWWKSLGCFLAGIEPGQRILDLAGGTGDMTRRLLERVGPQGTVVLADINFSMMSVGRDRLIDQGMIEQVHCVQANAESLPFAENHFDAALMAFGLRNVTDQLKALRSIYRCLKPGAGLFVLEFSKVQWPLLEKIYDAYSFGLVPKIGEWITGKAHHYQYLVESIRMHPNQIELKSLFEEAGFMCCDYTNMSGGIVALHRGYK
jgi:demethylmenaquinone methyltransferase/2-methoxy-6-polyprenyl-1,4-benzoquinol methylase